MKKSVSIVVRGIVQGVYYRQSTRAKAKEMNITGEVKNKTDGSVLIEATGEDNHIQEFIEWCKKGPNSAVVTDVEVIQHDVVDFESFKIIK